jgi:hypothetical protein
MRRILGLVAAAVFLSLGGSASDARAVVLGFDGTLALQIATLAPVAIPGSGPATVNGSLGGGHVTSLDLLASHFGTTGFVLDITDPGAFPIEAVKVTAHNGPAAFAGSGGAGFGGTMPIYGTAKVCMYGNCGGSSNISNLSVPLSVVGAGGVATVMAAINLSVIGAPWTTGIAAIGTITAMGGVSPLSNTGAPSGAITLVTPIFISTNIGSFAIVPAFGILTMHFIPEASTFLLLGSGLVATAAYGRSRTRRRRA